MFHFFILNYVKIDDKMYKKKLLLHSTVLNNITDYKKITEKNTPRS